MHQTVNAAEPADGRVLLRVQTGHLDGLGRDGTDIRQGVNIAVVQGLQIGRAVPVVQVAVDLYLVLLPDRDQRAVVAQAQLGGRDRRAGRVVVFCGRQGGFVGQIVHLRAVVGGLVIVPADQRPAFLRKALRRGQRDICPRLRAVAHGRGHFALAAVQAVADREALDRPLRIQRGILIDPVVDRGVPLAHLAVRRERPAEEGRACAHRLPVGHIHIGAAAGEGHVRDLVLRVLIEGQIIHLAPDGVQINVVLDALGQRVGVIAESLALLEGGILDLFRCGVEREAQKLLALELRPGGVDLHRRS